MKETAYRILREIIIHEQSRLDAFDIGIMFDENLEGTPALVTARANHEIWVPDIAACIVINPSRWDDMSELRRRIVIGHELCHLWPNNECSVLQLVGHDDSRFNICNAKYCESG